MGAFAAYTFCSGIFLLASYLVYKCMLAGDRQPRFNRVALLGLYIMSFLLPAFPVLNYAGVPEWSGGMATGEATAVLTALNETVDGGASIYDILLSVYVLGALITVGITCRSLIRLKKIIASGIKDYNDGYILVRVSAGRLTPLSIGRYIVVSGAEKADDIEMIIRHERAHIAARHYIDLILAQAVCIVLWYNPASWLMLSELKSVHEYQADETVLKSGTDARRYQMLLIKKAVGARFPFLVNSLNHSNLKKTYHYDDEIKNQAGAPTARAGGSARCGTCGDVAGRARSK